MIKPRSANFSEMSCMPWVGFDRQSLKKMNKFFADIPKRMTRGIELFELAAAKVLVDELQRAGTKIDGFDYTKKLKVVFVPSADSKEKAVAVYLDKREKELQGKDIPDTVVIVKSTGARAYVKVMEGYNPWPSSLLPKIEDGAAILVTRKVTPDENKRLEDRILVQKGTIVSQLRVGGLKIDELKVGDQSKGLKAYEDIAFALLRMEFGYGEPQRADWRSAIDVVVKKVDYFTSCLEKYIMTGRESVFDIPDRVDDGEESILKDGQKFSEKLKK